MASKAREKEFARWPRYRQLYINAFDKMLLERQRRGKMAGSWRIGTTAQDVYNWWMEYDIIPGQLEFADLAEDDGWED